LEVSVIDFVRKNNQLNTTNDTGLVPVIGLTLSGVYYVADLTARVRSLESEEFVNVLRDRFKTKVKQDALKLAPTCMEMHDRCYQVLGMTSPGKRE